FGGAPARAFLRSAGTVGSDSSAADAISRVTTSPASAPAASPSFPSTLSQWLFWPSGSRVALNGTPLILPSIAVMPREGSFALAFFGRTRKVQEPVLVLSAGRKSFALKRILEAVLVICLASVMAKSRSRERSTGCQIVHHFESVQKRKRRRLHTAAEAGPGGGGV